MTGNPESEISPYIVIGPLLEEQTHILGATVNHPATATTPKGETIEVLATLVSWCAKRYQLMSWEGHIESPTDTPLDLPIDGEPVTITIADRSATMIIFAHQDGIFQVDGIGPPPFGPVDDLQAPIQ